MTDTMELIGSYFSELFEVLCNPFHLLLVICKTHDKYTVVLFSARKYAFMSKKGQKRHNNSKVHQP